MFGAINSSASGLTAERLRMDTIADNLANANTTRTEDGGPYMRKVVQLEPRREQLNNFPSFARHFKPQTIAGRGVRAVGIVEAEGDPRRKFDPDHPDANEDGHLLMPNVDPIKEMVDMMTATRAYQANVTAIESAKTMFNSALDIAT